MQKKRLGSRQGMLPGEFFSRPNLDRLVIRNPFQLEHVTDILLPNSQNVEELLAVLDVLARCTILPPRHPNWVAIKETVVKAFAVINDPNSTTLVVAEARREINTLPTNWTLRATAQKILADRDRKERTEQKKLQRNSRPTPFEHSLISMYFPASFS